MLEFFQKLVSPARRSEEGASAVEYGLLVAGIAALVVAVVFLLGGQIQKSFKDTCNRVAQGSSSTASTTCGS